MLSGKTLGLIGCGRIGSWMSRYAHAFNMNVIGYDSYVGIWPDEMQKSDLDTLLGAADFVSIHVPLNAQTNGLIGIREFALMKPGAVLINTSRGSIIDEEALLMVLEQGRLGAAGLDVLDGEPTIDQHPLVVYARRRDNVVIMPHIGRFCPETVSLAVAYAARRIPNVLGDL